MTKKIHSLRSAAVLAIATLLTTCLIGGTFAKYVTSAEGTQTARVAAWGFNAPATLDLSGMFKSSYSNVAAADSSEVIIAPGTSGSVSFSFPFDETVCDAPEVKYSFSVNVTSDSDSDILSNPDIQYALDNGSWTTWDNIVTQIKTLSGDASGTKTYEAGTLPTAFTKDDDIHKLYWQWAYEKEVSGSTATNDSKDTALGNGTDLSEVNIKITITATQID